MSFSDERLRSARGGDAGGSNNLDAERAFEVCRTWCKRDGQSRLNFLGVNLDDVLQVKVFELLYPAAASVEAAGGWKNTLKKLDLDWTLKYAVSRVQSIGNGRSSDVWAVFDINNRSCIDMLNATAKELVKKGYSVGGLCVDPVVSQRIAVDVRSFSWVSEIPNVKSDVPVSSQRIKETFTRERDELYSNLVDEGVGEALASKILKRVGRQLDQLCREVIALRALLRRYRPRLLLFANDAHRVPRIMTQLARMEGIPTVSLQHGFPVWRYGYLPVFADRVLVWGDSSARWFQSMGTDEARVVVAGDPRRLNGGPSLTASAFPQNRRLFWLPNPVGRPIVQRFASRFFALAENWTGGVCIKLHPSESGVEWYRSLIPASMIGRVDVSTAPLQDCGLGYGDIVVVGNSTAGLDAVEAGALVINLHHDSLPNPIDYTRYPVGVEGNLDTPTRSLLDSVLSIDSKSYSVARVAFLADHFANFAHHNGTDGVVTQLCHELCPQDRPES